MIIMQKKQPKHKYQLKMEAAIELLAMLRQSNASHFYITAL